MGLQLCTPVGSVVMHKFLIASCLAVAALAAPEAEADAYYGSLAATWPGIRGLGIESTCYGCRGHYLGKRSADAHGYGYGISQLHPSGHSFQQVTRLHKREAEAEPEADAYYGYGYGPGYGHGYGHRLGYHGLGYSHGGYYGHGYGHGYGYGYGYGYHG